ncbi:hypothetical protein [uncultured Corynebacterium sp.]|uniref:hypothetical protein n=1 Tax=uncultured Corynebacterium sp. TaxID=159447 RepID=UPI0025D663CE|nr:hypothetical protein [uncultured Corynebacterium sp.]
MNTQQAFPESSGDRSVVVAAAELVDAVTEAVVDCLGRSAVVRRLSDGSLPFAGRVAWLEQHWEGLRILRDCVVVPAGLRAELAASTGRLNLALDRAHASARWRDRHVTMPSMLTFRRHVAGLREDGDLLGLAAQAYVRLLAAGVGSGLTVTGTVPRPAAGLHRDLCSMVSGQEDLELLSEELSAGLLMVMQHGSDVCRAYRDAMTDESCAVTVATIRDALR